MSGCRDFLAGGQTLSALTQLGTTRLSSELLCCGTISISTRRTLVKNVFRVLVAAMLMFSLSAFAQADKQAKKTEKAQQKEAKTAAKGKTASLTGWIKTSGDKTMFTND